MNFREETQILLIDGIKYANAGLGGKAEVWTTLQIPHLDFYEPQRANSVAASLSGLIQPRNMTINQITQTRKPPPCTRHSPPNIAFTFLCEEKHVNPNRKTQKKPQKRTPKQLRQLLRRL